MGVFRKLKDIFYDEEIIEEEIPEVKPIIKKVEKEPIKKPEEPLKKEPVKPIISEEIKRVIPEEKIREEYKKPEEVKKEVTERELYQNKQTFKFPILDDEEVFEERRVKKTRSNSTNIMDIERRNREIKRKEVVEEPVKPKVFKPSPVISPIYGIIDKDYDKTEYMNRNKEATTTRTSVDYDTIRRKAYGETKEMPKIEAAKVLENVNEIESELDRVKEKSNIESLLESIEENTHLTVGDMEEVNKIENITSEVSRLDKYKNNAESTNLNNIGDKTLEHDLFNLIDSMYEEEKE